MFFKVLKTTKEVSGMKYLAGIQPIGLLFCATLLISVNGNAEEYVPYYSQSGDSSANSDINPGLYPPLSSGEASPWQEELPETESVPVIPQDNPWTATQPQGAVPQNYAVPQVIQPYGYQPPQTGYQPYQQPYQYQYNPYAQGMMAPPMPYGYSNPYGGGYPGYGANNWNNGGFNPFNNSGFNPFNFSMPFPF